MRRESGDKKELLFAAVIDLIEEGRDLHAMKVIDITNRAGIGKGTAYEYFKSKEELVIRALLHDIEQQRKELEEALRGQPDFYGQVMTAMRFLEKKRCRRRSDTQFFRLIGDSYEIPEELRREFGAFSKKKMEPFERILDLLIEQGEREGTIGPGQERRFLRLALVSSFITYFLYLNQEEKGTEEERGKAREFFFGNLCRGLCP